MKPNILLIVPAFLCLLFSGVKSYSQTFGTSSSAVWLSDCNQSNFYNTSGNPADLPGPAGNVFTNANLGVHTQNSGTLILRGAEVRTFKNVVANVCSVRMFYRIYLQSAVPGSFNSIDLPFLNDCDIPSSQFPSGGPCQAGDQKWNRVIPNGATTPYAPVNLTSFVPGNYVLEVYYDVAGSSTTTTLCDETIVLNNGGNNYKAFFSIQAPLLASNNPTTCNGSEGYITISGLVPGATYAFSYTDDGVSVGPVNLVANGSGQGFLNGLNAGVYSDLELVINGCVTDLFTGIILTDPLFTPTFPSIPPFCAGSTAPLLPTTSINGINGTWSPAVINNMSSGSYKFTPVSGQCGLTFTRNVTVIQKTTPTFSFGTSLSICNGAAVPALPTTSINGFTGTWSPSAIDNQNSATYTFTPNINQCANPATLTVTVNPILTTTFSFGTALTICAGQSVPALVATSSNGITGTWSPASVDNQNSGTYTFTPNIGQCGTIATFDVTVNPNITPTFSFGPALTICIDETVPVLPGTSDNSITGTWSPAIVSNQASATYTFTPTPGLCALPATFTVTVNPKITPTFSFGASLAICAGGTVPALPGTSTNSINGTWNPATIDDQNSATYTFTPDIGECATPASFSVTVNPILPTTFSFGTTLTICSGQSVPALPNTSSNGIAGTWSPASVDNQNSDTYTFTPNAGQCGTIVNFIVTVNPNITPTFSFGTTSSICSGGIVPALPITSDNAITGTWNPAVVSDQASATYTFTPTPGLCSFPATFTVSVTPNETPTFSFGTTLTICAGEAVPALPNTSDNAIAGTWSPASVDDQNSSTYTFTPTSGLCATTATFTVTVNPNITPAFSFGTSQTYCAGASVPALPGTSDNAISGTWNTASVDNLNSAIYTFTPAAGLCATTATFTVTINPIVTPTFSFGTTLTICSGGIVPALPNTSDNAITGTWNAVTVDNQNSATYTFTPTAGLCANPATFAVTVNPNITPTFSFGTAQTFCAGAVVPLLPGISDNGINGTWDIATVDDQNSGVYTFTPTPAPGLCATTATFTVTVNSNITPTFNFGAAQTYCEGTTVPALATTSIEAITGTWSPASVDNLNSGVYTFTPAVGECAIATTFTVTITPNETPTFSFGTTLTICAGGIVPALPNISDNAINGTWNIATVDNQSSATYTFTPTAGLCAIPATFAVTVNPNITPTFSFGTAQTFCAGAVVPLLPGISDNGINGTWDIATVDDQNSGVYTFTPTAGLCATIATFTVTVNSIITPTFSFGTVQTFCAGTTVPALPGTSDNAITGTWSPVSVDNLNSGVYTFTPAVGECAIATTFTVTITPNETPTFSFGTTLTICAGGIVPALPNISDNAINGTWNIATVDNQSSATYTFTPTAGLCAIPAIFAVIVNPNITPTFSFGTAQTFCAGAVVPLLPGISDNGITGTWDIASVDNQNSATYTFTPTAGLCATNATFIVTVNPILTTTFSIGTDLTICSGSAVPTLLSLSDNGINGTWSPATIDNQASGIYTFTPATGQCGTTATFTVTVTPSITPTFNFGPSLTICKGTAAPLLPTTSLNGYDGVWNPAVVSNQDTGLYTFTPVAPPAQCITTITFKVNVNPILTPTFSFGTTLSICSGATVPALPTTSANNITGTWNPAVVSNQASGVYTFTSTAGQCAAATATFTVTVNPTPTVTTRADTTVNDGAVITVTNFSETPAGVNYSWTNSNPAIGLPASGTGNIPSFTGINRGNDPISSTITVTPTFNGCTGTTKSYTITVKALNKDVFVPNVFSPNGDGKNDVLFVYGNYIQKLEMRIFNQWGEQVELINSKAKGWDGSQRGKQQPVGVYVYVLQAELLDGRKVNLKGSITLVR